MKNILTKIVKGFAWVGMVILRGIVKTFEIHRVQNMTKEQLMLELLHVLRTYELDLQAYSEACKLVVQMRCLHPFESETWSATNEMVTISRKRVKWFLFCAGPRMKFEIFEHIEQLIQTKTKIRELERETGSKPLELI